MSSRIPALLLQSLYKKRCHFNFHMISCLGSKSLCSSANIEKSINVRNVQFSKFVQPLTNLSVDDILSEINHESISPDEAIGILKALRMQILFKNINPNCFKNDTKFEILCEVFQSSCPTLRPAMLVSGLRSLLEVGVSPNSSCVLSAEEAIINSICLFSTFNLICCLYFHHKYMETELQEKVVCALTTELCRRAYEISTPAEVLMLVNFLHVFKNEKDLRKIQQKIVELIPYLSSTELCKMLGTLSESSNRNIYILNAISCHLQNKMQVIDMKEVLDILYSFKKLSFHDSKLLTFLMTKVIPEIPKVTQPSVISGLLTTCGHIRWKQPALLNACGEWICSHFDSCRAKEFVSYILTVATLKHNDSEVKSLVKTMLPYVNLQTIESPDVWLDTVWSLAILNIVDKETLLKVLSPEFYNPLISGSDFKTVTNKLKLMNLKAVLKMHYPECIFRCDLFLEPSEVPQSLEIENCRKHVINVLNNFVPKSKYVCIGQNTDTGIFIDAEFIMDVNGKPLPISEFGLLSKPTSAKPLPEGYQRIALLIMFYKDRTLNLESVTGCNALATQLLSAQGYTVVRVPFDEFLANHTEIRKAKYLFNKIIKAINLAKQSYQLHNTESSKHV